MSTAIYDVCQWCDGAGERDPDFRCIHCDGTGMIDLNDFADDDEDRPAAQEGQK